MNLETKKQIKQKFFLSSGVGDIRKRIILFSLQFLFPIHFQYFFFPGAVRCLKYPSEYLSH